MREISRGIYNGSPSRRYDRRALVNVKEIKHEKRPAARRRRRRKSYARYHCPVVTQIRCLSLNQSEK